MKTFVEVLKPWIITNNKAKVNKHRRFDHMPLHILTQIATARLLDDIDCTVAENVCVLAHQDCIGSS